MLYDRRAAAVGFVALLMFVEPAPCPADEATKIRGRVLDEASKPVTGSRVRLYFRESRWSRRHPVIEETTAGPDGVFHLKSPLKPVAPSQSRGLPPYVLVADHPSKALGWRTIPMRATRFEGDIVLTPPSERTITVLDSDGRGVPGVKVEAYDVDGRTSEPLALRPEDGPLTATTGEDGRATFRRLPRADASFVATKPGFAEGYAFRKQDTIRISPSAAVSGTLTGPDGRPLAGVKIVMFTGFMWDFEHAVTDANGRFELENLRARGWDMSAWGPSSRPGNGHYKVWIDSDRFAIPTRDITLEPGQRATIQLQARKAGVIRVTVIDEEHEKPVPNVRVWGFDQATGVSSRFNAYTNDQGEATFYSAPETIVLEIAGPPDGTYIKGEWSQHHATSMKFEFPGPEYQLRLVMPPVGGPLISVSGVSARPDGTTVAGVDIRAEIGAKVSLTRSHPHGPTERADAAGRFDLHDVPAGQPLLLHGESEDRKLAGTATIQIPAKADPGFRVILPMEPTVAVEMVARDSQGQLLAFKKIHYWPRVGETDFLFRRRTVESDANGRIRFEGIVRGLSYKVQEGVPPTNGPVAFVGGKPPWYEEVLVLAPGDPK